MAKWATTGTGVRGRLSSQTVSCQNDSERTISGSYDDTGSGGEAVCVGGGQAVWLCI
jgi:hypothetical protein